MQQDATATDTAATLRQTLQALNVQRESLEQESLALVGELTAVNPENPTAPPMGIDTPLVDAEGYPRNDIDVFHARALRQRLAQARTDHKQLMRQLESHLHQLALLHQTTTRTSADKTASSERQEMAARQEAKPKPKYDPVTGKWVVRNWDGTIAGAGGNHNGRSFDQLSETTAQSAPPTTNSPLTAGMAPMSIQDNDDGNARTESIIHRASKAPTSPFCRVESVAPSSPADVAGLQVEDQILALGPHSSLTEVMDLVLSTAADQGTIELRVWRRRSDNDNRNVPVELLLQLKPRPWSGRGLLGCHIVPV